MALFIASRAIQRDQCNSFNLFFGRQRFPLFDAQPPGRAGL